MKLQQDSASCCSPMGAGFSSALMEPRCPHNTDSISGEKAHSCLGTDLPMALRPPVLASLLSTLVERIKFGGENILL